MTTARQRRRVMKALPRAEPQASLPRCPPFRYPLTMPFAPRDHAGRALAWVVAALVLVAAAVVIYLAAQPSPPDASAPASPFDEAAATAQLEALQQNFAAAVQNQRDPRPLLADAQALVDQYPEWAPPRLTYAQLLLLSRRDEQGYEQLQKGLALDPAQPEAQVLAGSTAMRLKRLPDAERHYSQAVALQPENSMHRLMLATAQLRQSKYDDARQTLLQAIRLDSSSDAAYATLSDVYKAQNQVGLALDQINRALSLVAENDAQRREVYLRKKASLLLRNNQPTEAMRALRELPAQRLIDPEISKELADIWMRLQQPQRAANHYEQILIINPVADWAAARAAHYRLKAGQPAEAKKNLDALRRINPRAEQINDLERALREARGS